MNEAMASVTCRGADNVSVEPVSASLSKDNFNIIYVGCPYARRIWAMGQRAVLCDPHNKSDLNTDAKLANALSELKKLILNEDGFALCIHAHPA